MRVLGFVLFCFSVLDRTVRESVYQRMTFEEGDEGAEVANLGQSAPSRGSDRFQFPEKEVGVE